jgi:hypothetical protein
MRNCEGKDIEEERRKENMKRKSRRIGRRGKEIRDRNRREKRNSGSGLEIGRGWRRL